MTDWTEGEQCRIVELDDTMEPRENGTAFKATVTRVGKSFVKAKTREPEFATPTAFYPETGWMVRFDHSWWRLMPETNEAATAAGGKGSNGG